MRAPVTVDDKGYPVQTDAQKERGGRDHSKFCAHNRCLELATVVHNASDAKGNQVVRRFCHHHAGSYICSKLNENGVFCENRAVIDRAHGEPALCKLCGGDGKPFETKSKPVDWMKNINKEVPGGIEHCNHPRCNAHALPGGRWCQGHHHREERKVAEKQEDAANGARLIAAAEAAKKAHAKEAARSKAAKAAVMHEKVSASKEAIRKMARAEKRESDAVEAKAAAEKRTAAEQQRYEEEIKLKARMSQLDVRVRRSIEMMPAGTGKRIALKAALRDFEDGDDDDLGGGFGNAKALSKGGRKMATAFLAANKADTPRTKAAKLAAGQKREAEAAEKRKRQEQIEKKAAGMTMSQLDVRVRKSIQTMPEGTGKRLALKAALRDMADGEDGDLQLDFGNSRAKAQGGRKMATAFLAANKAVTPSHVGK